MAAFPYNIDNLLGGAVRVLYADPNAATPVPAPGGIDDVISMVAPYTAKTGWVDLGATKESFTYTRGFETEGWEIQQAQGPVIEEVTSITRTIEVSVAEFRPSVLSILENSGVVVDLAAATGVGAQKQVQFGSFSSPKRYRFAFVSRRSTASGIVKEAAGAGAVQRGRFFMGVLYLAQIAADDVSMEQAKGALTATGVTFTSFPDTATSSDEGEEYGSWFDEQAGTLT
jgi:hypothetical protein